MPESTQCRSQLMPESAQIGMYGMCSHAGVSAGVNSCRSQARLECRGRASAQSGVRSNGQQDKRGRGAKFLQIIDNVAIDSIYSDCRPRVCAPLLLLLRLQRVSIAVGVSCRGRVSIVNCFEKPIFSTVTNRLKLPRDGAYLDNRAYDIIDRTLKRARAI
jgi:hypothetical protein